MTWEEILKQKAEEPTLLIEGIKDKLNDTLIRLEQSERDFSKSEDFEATRRIKHGGNLIQIMLYVHPFHRLMIGRVSMSKKIPSSASFIISKEKDKEWNFNWLRTYNETISEELQRKLLGVVEKMTIVNI